MADGNSNGRLIVIGMLGIVLVWVMAGLLWKDAPPPIDERAAAPVPPLPEEEEGGGLRITERKADGSVVVTNAPKGEESRIERSRKRRAAEAAAKAERGEDENPFAGFVDDGQPITASAMKDVDMRTLTGNEDEYDGAVEARQRFNSLELDLLAEMPLNPDLWRSVMADHGDDVKGVFKRAKELADAGLNEEGRALLEEWAELQQKYQAQAYGRAPQPSGL